MYFLVKRGRLMGNLFVIALVATCIDSGLSITLCTLIAFELVLTGQVKFMA